MDLIAAYIPGAALNASTIQQLPLALPEIFLLIMASIILVVDLFVSSKSRGTTYILSQATLIGQGAGVERQNEDSPGRRGRIHAATPSLRRFRNAMLRRAVDSAKAIQWASCSITGSIPA